MGLLFHLMGGGQQFNYDMILLIIQARLGSTRFRRKVIKHIAGLPSIVYQYKRIKKVRNKIKSIVAIPEGKAEEKLKEILNNYQINFFEGDEKNVFQRFLDCALFNNAKIIIRINGDCPLISPSTIDKTIDTFFKSKNSDYVSTTLDQSYPIGEHVELFTLEALKKASLMKKSKEEEEHVTPIFYRNQNIFKCIQVEKLYDYPPQLRLCVDYKEDLDFVREIANNFYPYLNFEIQDIINFIKQNKKIMYKNSKFKKSRKLEN